MPPNAWVETMGTCETCALSDRGLDGSDRSFGLLRVARGLSENFDAIQSLLFGARSLQRFERVQHNVRWRPERVCSVRWQFVRRSLISLPCFILLIVPALQNAAEQTEA